MTLRTVLATTMLGLSILACSGESTETQNDLLVSPWKEMNLPAGGSTILTNTSDQLLVAWETYDGGLSALDSSWKSAVEANGYKQVENLSGNGVNAYIYTKDSAMFGLAPLEEDGVVGAYMEDLGKVKDSVVRKGGVRDTVKSRRGGGGTRGGGAAAPGGARGGGGAPGGGAGKAGKAGKAD